MRHIGIVLTSAVVAMHPALAQAPAQTPMSAPAVSHVGIVVPDVDEAVRRFQDIFGVAIERAQERPLAFRGTPPRDATASRLKVAAFRLPKMGFEIIQPLAGPSPQRQYLDRYGQGPQYVAFEVKDAQAALTYLVSKGGTRTTSTEVDMQDILGFSAEVRESNTATAAAATRVQTQTPLSNRAISHIGIVVRDIDKTGQAFSEIFGVPASRAQAASLTMPEGRTSSEPMRIRFANFVVGNMRFELVQPVSGPSPHSVHLARFGQSLHHIGFTLEVPKAGIDYLVSKGGVWRTAPSVDMRTILGFQAELLTP